MSKKFKGKTCAYCVRDQATTADHVFAREFFTHPNRHNLPKVPACAACNNVKSQFEHYLTAVLPFAGRHTHAVETLVSGVPGRLAKNQKLNHEMIRSMEPAWIKEDNGLYQKTSMVDFDSGKLIGWLRLVGRGLAWHHWGLYLKPDDDASVMLMTDQNSAIWAAMTGGWQNARRVTINLGNGTVEYVGVQASDPPELTMWTVRMYGGLVLSDDRHCQNGEMQSCSMWWIVTGPQELHQGFSRLK